MSTTRRHTSSFLVAVALVIVGLFTQHSIVAAHAAAPSAASATSCTVALERAGVDPLTVAQGAVTDMCSTGRFSAPAAVAARGHQTALSFSVLHIRVATHSAENAARPLSTAPQYLQACAQPGYR